MSFPALQAMAKRGHLDVPVIGVARSGWNREQLEARVKESLETHGGIGDTSIPAGRIRRDEALVLADREAAAWSGSESSRR